MKRFMMFLSLVMVMMPVAYANTAKTVLAKAEVEAAAPEGAFAVLYKTDKGCLIEYTEYYETGKQQYNYVFNKIGLISAAQIKFYYANGGLSNPKNKSIKVSKQEKTYIDIKNTYVMLEFEDLKHKFRKEKLNACW